jgi:hypothetical protein
LILKHLSHYSGDCFVVFDVQNLRWLRGFTLFWGRVGGTGIGFNNSSSSLLYWLSQIKKVLAPAMQDRVHSSMASYTKQISRLRNGTVGVL